MSYILSFLGVFLAMTITDICWTFYLLKVEERKSVQAGLWASVLYLFGATVVTAYVGDKSLIIAAMLGSFFGTYITLEYKKRTGK